MKKEYLIILFFAIIVISVGLFLGRDKISSIFVKQNSASNNTSNLVSPTPNLSNEIYLVKNDSNKGNYLTDLKGMTLYSFDRDTIGRSNCYDSCAITWPAYVFSVNPSSIYENIGVITRTDRNKQWAWKGKALYFYSGDKNAGDINGDGIEGTWHIVTP